MSTIIKQLSGKNILSSKSYGKLGRPPAPASCLVHGPLADVSSLCSALLGGKHFD